MPDEEKKNDSTRRAISEKDRFKFIGFEVFPGKPKDLFKSDAEKKKLVDAVIEKRKKGEIREDCTLLEERVSLGDKIVLTIACVTIFITLFIPWYSVYNEVEETAKHPSQAVADSSMVAASVDSLVDSMAVAAENPDTTSILAEATSVESADSLAAAGTEENPPGVASEQRSASEEVLHGYVARKKVYKEFHRVSALGSFISLGSIGSYVFSSGPILVLTALIFLIYTLLCIALPAYTLTGLYGGKGTPDDRALRLKKILRYNWLPLILFVLTLFLSFLGASYSFNTATIYSSLGSGYGIGVFLDTLSWGIIVSLAAFILVAAKGSEI